MKQAGEVIDLFCWFWFLQPESKTPKQRLLGWIQHKLPDVPINNFSQDWRNGRALGALVDSCAPGMCVCVCVF